MVIGVSLLHKDPGFNFQQCCRENMMRRRDVLLVKDADFDLSEQHAASSWTQAAVLNPTGNGIRLSQCMHCSMFTFI